MIEQLKAVNNINFRGNNSVSEIQMKPQGLSSFAKAVNEGNSAPVEVLHKQSSETLQEVAPKEKTSVKQVFYNIRNGFIHMIKGYNNITNIAEGALKGVAAGIIATGAVGFIGRNFKNGEGKIINTLGSMLKNAGEIIWGAMKIVPDVLTKQTPWESIKKLAGAPNTFFKDYLKNNKATGYVAVAVGLSVLAYSIIRGKFNANRANSEVDHTMNEGHNKY